MSKILRRRWEPRHDLGPSIPRRDRRSCEYEAYVPDPLVGRDFTFEGPVTADIADAEHAIARLDAGATALSDTETLARLLLRAESAASSKIEGLEIGARRLLRSDLAAQLGEPLRDVTALEVLANIDAVSFALRTIGKGNLITIDVLLEAHRRLLANGRLSEYAGRIRNEQNWIGGSSFNPCSASFVPAPPELVPSLLEDVCAFSNSDTLPPIAQAAIAHAQFETIHPFIDGNGRVGRAFIHMILRRRGLTLRVLPPISLVLATWAQEYINGLTATRYVGSPTSKTARDGMNVWVGRFAAACVRAVSDADAFEDRVRHIETAWRERLVKVRMGSALDLLLRKLPGAPILTVQSAARLIHRTFPAANAAIARLVESGILIPINTRHRNRAFEARDLIDAFSDLERQLASPDGDTITSPPIRNVPYRRQRNAP